MSASPQSRTIALSTGLTYHCLEWGDDLDIDETVILVHGFLDLSWSWQPTVQAGLGKRFHIIAPDMRGHGDSDRVGAGGYYHFADYVADLHAVVQQTARGTVSLVGHSMGGTIASYYTGAFPERIRRLALLEGLGPPESDIAPPQRVARWLGGWHRATTRSPRSYATVAAAADRLVQHDPLLSPEMAQDLAAQGTTPTADGVRFKHDPLHLTMSPQPFRIEYASSFWRQITCPVLLVDGALSELRHPADEAQRRRAHFSDAHHIVIDGAGHLMLRHQPQALSDALVQFLTM